MSGLTVGYLSVDDLTMELKEANGTEEEKALSAKILPVLSNRRWLHVTLLLMNAFAFEALPVFLDRIVNRFWAVVISVSLILVFGEVLPQALCTGPNQNKIAAMAAPFTYCLMVVSWPLSYWIGRLLDIILGEHHKTRYLNTDLKALVELHTYSALKKLQEEEEQHKYIPKEEIAKPSDKMGLNDLEANIMISALEIREKNVSDVMIPFNQVYTLDFEENIEKEKITSILSKGYSRIPIYIKQKNNIIGILRIKQLINVDVTQNKSLRELGIHLKSPIVIHPNMKLIDVLREFKKGKSHMAFVTEQVEKLQNKLGLNRTNSIAYGSVLNFNARNDGDVQIKGIVTLEDVVEKIFNLEILDEDEYEVIKNQKMKLPQGQRTESKLQAIFTRGVAQNFIDQESKAIHSMIRDSKKKRNMKDNFIDRMDIEMTSTNNLKESLV